MESTVTYIKTKFREEFRDVTKKAHWGVISAIFFFILPVTIPAIDSYNHYMSPYRYYQLHLKSLYEGLVEYSEKNKNKYPSSETWCDELLKNELIRVQSFSCIGADPNYYEKETNISHYAMNPDCEPNSPGDVVLLFDSKPGWNQHGGAELLAPENHQGKGCNILFNDGTVKFIKKKHLDKLRWE